MISDARAPAFDELVRERRSIRQFRSEPVSRSLVAEVLRMALWAPSPHNVQPWRFTVLMNSAGRLALADAMAARLRADLRRDAVAADVIEQQTARSRWRLSNAPVVLVCSLVSDGLVSFNDTRRATLEWQMAVQSVGAVLQTLFLAAAARQLGTCWMAAPMYCPDEVIQTLGLPPDYVPQALVLMGYPAAPGKARDRRDFDELVTFG